MRKKIAAGNWKMNNNRDEAIALVEGLLQVAIPDNTEVILGVPYLYLHELQGMVSDSQIQLAAQNCHQEKSGAYTGEISASMLKSIGIETVILGHSERREYFDETDELLSRKLRAALDEGLKVIFCCGEPLSVREAGEHVAYVKKQLTEGLFQISEEDLGSVVIAYEPVWAIGTGVTASKEQVQEMHHEIRKMIADNYQPSVADKTHILYGGSVKPANAAELFAQPDVDGGLVGGASLKASDFGAIIQA